MLKKVLVWGGVLMLLVCIGRSPDRGSTLVRGWMRFGADIAIAGWNEAERVLNNL